MTKIYFKNQNSKINTKKMNKMKTIIATPNYTKKTFTIRTYINGKINAKYRTIQMSKKEFEAELNNTQNDWMQFLKSNDYYLVKSY